MLDNVLPVVWGIMFVATCVGAVLMGMTLRNTTNRRYSYFMTTMFTLSSAVYFCNVIFAFK